MCFIQINITENKPTVSLVFKDERLKVSVLLRSQTREVWPFLSRSLRMVKVVLWEISQEKIKQKCFQRRKN